MNVNRRTMLMMCAASCVPAIRALAVNPGTYYTTANIWYEHPEKIYSTNYHAGKIIPIGTEVEVLFVKKTKVQFTIKDKETLFLYTYVKKHSSLGFEEEFGRIFSAKNSFAEYSKNFTVTEKKSIKEGRVLEGMRREAVLAAYGYPPSHVTPDLDDDHWTFWVKRTTTKQVVFENGKVTSVK